MKYKRTQGNKQNLRRYFREINNSEEIIESLVKTFYPRDSYQILK